MMLLANLIYIDLHFPRTNFRIELTVIIEAIDLATLREFLSCVFGTDVIYKFISSE